MENTNNSYKNGIYAESRGIDHFVTTIQGVQYIVFSFFDGDKPVYDKIGEMIKRSFETSVEENIPGEPLSKIV